MGAAFGFGTRPVRGPGLHPVPERRQTHARGHLAQRFDPLQPPLLPDDPVRSQRQVCRQPGFDEAPLRVDGPVPGAHGFESALLPLVVAPRLPVEPDRTPGGDRAERQGAREEDDGAAQ